MSPATSANPVLRQAHTDVARAADFDLKTAEVVVARGAVEEGVDAGGVAADADIDAPRTLPLVGARAEGAKAGRLLVGIANAATVVVVSKVSTRRNGTYIRARRLLRIVEMVRRDGGGREERRFGARRQPARLL